MAYLVISHQAPPRLIPMKDGTIGFESPYDPDLVAALKVKIPYSDRRWDRDQKMWFVAPQHAETLADLAEQYLGQRPRVPTVQAQAQEETRLLDVRYIGAAKERAGGQVPRERLCRTLLPLGFLDRVFQFDHWQNQINRKILPIVISQNFTKLLPTG